MNRWKVAFFTALVALVLSNGYWFYQLIDVSISYSYLMDSYDDQSAKVDKLGGLIVAGSAEYSKADILHLLRQSDPSALIVEETDTIGIDRLTFTFENDRLVDVQ